MSQASAAFSPCRFLSATAAEFAAAIDALRRELAPAGAIEAMLVEMILAAAARLRRAFAAEGDGGPEDKGWMRYQQMAERSWWKAFEALQKHRRQARRRADERDAEGEAGDRGFAMQLLGGLAPAAATGPEPAEPAPPAAEPAAAAALPDAGADRRAGRPPIERGPDGRPLRRRRPRDAWGRLIRPSEPAAAIVDDLPGYGDTGPSDRMPVVPVMAGVGPGAY